MWTKNCNPNHLKLMQAVNLTLYLWGVLCSRRTSVFGRVLPHSLYFPTIPMNVLDKILQAENEASAIIAAATSAAAEQVAQARKTALSAIAAEHITLAEAETVELESCAQQVQKKVEVILSEADTQVTAIKAAFTEKKAELQTKINNSLA